MSTGIAAEARMGNDIARQFGHLSDQEAAEHIATHVEKFWEQRMINRLLTLVRAQDPSLDPLLARAMAHWVVDDVDHRSVEESSGG